MQGFFMIINIDMRINEIIELLSREEPMEKYQHIFDNATPTPAFSNLNFVEVLDNTNEIHYLGLLDPEKILVSFLELEIRDHQKYQITYSQTEPKYRRQGCFRYLLNKAVTSHGEILSDTHQTPEAISTWKSLIKFPSYLKIGVLNTDTGIITSTWHVSEEEIWHQKVNPVLIASDSRTEYSQKLQEMTERNNEWKKKRGRDHDSLWYGPETSNDNYENP